VALSGKAVTDTDDVQAALEASGVGQSVEAEVLRGGVPNKAAIAIGERPWRS